MSIRHFPTGLPYREVGETRIFAKDDATVNFLGGMFETFEQNPAADYPRTTETSSHVNEDLAKSCPEVAEDFCETITQEFTVTEINWLKRIEAMLRNA